jgi:hypothetical protein
MKTIYLPNGFDTRGVPKPEHGDILVCITDRGEHKSLVSSTNGDWLSVAWQEGDELGLCGVSYDPKTETLSSSDIARRFPAGSFRDIVERLKEADMWTEGTR